jgi:hypothetical protein
MDCHHVRNLEPLAELRSLATLELAGCEEAGDLSPLVSLPALRSVNVTGVNRVKGADNLRRRGVSLYGLFESPR